LHLPRFTPFVPAEITPGQPLPGTAGAVERFSSMRRSMRVRVSTWA